MQKFAKKQRKIIQKSAVEKVAKLEYMSCRLSLIATSSSNTIFGREIITHIKFISIESFLKQADAELNFLLAVDAVGANGVVDLNIYKIEQTLCINGNAVLLMENTSESGNKRLFYNVLQNRKLKIKP